MWTKNLLYHAHAPGSRQRRETTIKVAKTLYRADSLLQNGEEIVGENYMVQDEAHLSPSAVGMITCNT